jgi:signal transduction histidine kinase
VKIGDHIVNEHARKKALVQTLVSSVSDRITAIVELLDETPAAGREPLLRALNSPLFEVRCQTEQPAPVDDEPWFADDARQLLQPALNSLRRPYRIQNLHHRRRHDDGSSASITANTATETLPGRYSLVISVADTTCGWLIVTIAGSILQLYWQDGPGVFGFVFMAVLIGLVVIWLTHRETRPLRRFAEAADRLGVDVHAPSLPEKGSRELRKATRAFNRMQERLQRFVDDRTQMLAAISHDLRTVLTRLQLRADFIDDQEQRDKALKDLAAMQTMLNATLEFARDDNASEARTALDIAVLLQSLCDDWSDTGEQTDYQGPEHLTFSGRPVALQRMFSNLIENALRYGKEAKIALQTDKDNIRIAVADRGPGIASELREKVFAPFFRLEPSRNRQTGGTGLGLAVARSIARRHGGDIVLADNPGGGLLVQVQLPRTQSG